MDQKTRDALEASIKHHEECLAESRPDLIQLGVKSCALCRQFYKYDRENNELNCDGCPVKERTGENGCEGSPYEDAFDLMLTWESSEEEADRDRYRAAEQCEIDFLKSLRPKDEEPTPP